MLPQPNWIIVMILSGVFGYLVQYIVKIPSFLHTICKKNDIRGKWNHYFYCESDNSVPLRTATYTIKTGFLHNYKVKCECDGIIYRGYGFIEQNHLCITYAYGDKLSKETVNLRFQVPTVTNRDKLIGIWLSYDYNNRLSSGVSILSRSTLSNMQLYEIVLSIRTTNTNIII